MANFPPKNHMLVCYVYFGLLFFLWAGGIYGRPPEEYVQKNRIYQWAVDLVKAHKQQTKYDYNVAFTAHPKASYSAKTGELSIGFYSTTLGNASDSHNIWIKGNVFTGEKSLNWSFDLGETPARKNKCIVPFSNTVNERWQKLVFQARDWKPAVAKADPPRQDIKIITETGQVGPFSAVQIINETAGPVTFKIWGRRLETHTLQAGARRTIVASWRSNTMRPLLTLEGTKPQTVVSPSGGQLGGSAPLTQAEIYPGTYAITGSSTRGYGLVRRK